MNKYVAFTTLLTTELTESKQRSQTEIQSVTSQFEQKIMHKKFKIMRKLNRSAGWCTGIRLIILDAFL